MGAVPEFIGEGMAQPTFGRRRFLAGAVAIGAALALPGPALAHPPAGEIRVDVAIIGGGLGGYSALLALREAGHTVAISSPFAWFGGQLTSQGVPLDEQFWIETIPGSRLYAEFRQQLRRWYRLYGGLTTTANTTLWLNPGDAVVSRLCAEPQIAAAVIDDGIAAASPNGEVVTLRGYLPVRVERSGDRIDAVILRSVDTADEVTVIARYFIDATELGDLLELGGVEYVTGAEGRAQTGEPSAPTQADPLDQQAITWSFAVEQRRERGAASAPPDSYAAWRGYRPQLTPAWPGPLFSWTYTQPKLLRPHTVPLFDPQRVEDLWSYRRIRAAQHFATASNEATLVNWPQNDYFLRPLVGPGVTPEQRQAAQDEARDLSRAFLHWLQTDAPRHDGGTGYPELQPLPAALGTADGFAMHPYIREGRRILGQFTVQEQHIGIAARRQYGLPTDHASVFAESVGIGHYDIDLHPSTGGRNYLHQDCLPYQIPWGALIPRRVENLLAVGLGIATTHLTNGAYRIHSTEFATGVAAGYGLAFCLERDATPAAVRLSPSLLAEFQQRLTKRGVRLAWPASRTTFTDLNPFVPGAGAIWCLADQGIVRGYAPNRFGPNDRITRAQVAALLCRLLGWTNEEWPNPFTDRGGLDAELWRDVGTLAGRGIAKGYADGTFRPNEPVSKVQAISFIARAFVAHGRWTWQERPGCYPNIPASSGHRQDAETFVAHTTGLDGQPYSDPWPDAFTPAPRWWFTAALHLALEHPTPEQ